MKLYGAGNGASLAARWRSKGEYRTALILEGFFGERRGWDERGQTMHEVFTPRFDEFDQRVTCSGYLEPQDRDYQVSRRDDVESCRRA